MARPLKYVSFIDGLVRELEALDVKIAHFVRMRAELKEHIDKLQPQLFPVSSDIPSDVPGVTESQDSVSSSATRKRNA